MDWLIWIAIYLTCGFVTSLVSTKMSYKKALKENKNPVPKSIVERGNVNDIDILEEKRRKKLATESLTAGFWAGLFWPIIWVAFVILFICGMGMHIIHSITIKPEDRPFVSERELRKAQAIVDKYEQEKRAEFEKELGE